MNNKERKRISDYFNQMSDEDFKKMLKKNGYGSIKKKEKSNYYQVFSVSQQIEREKEDEQSG